jgi:phage terminase small subunit
MNHKILTPRQLRFIEEFARDRNAAAAYRRAGYTGRHANARAVEVGAAPAVRAAIERNERDAVREATADAARIVGRYATIAFASVAHYIAIAPDGTIEADPADVDAERMAALVAFDVRERRVSKKAGGGRIRRIRVRLADKLGALDALARQLGLFVARNEDRFRRRPAELRAFPAPEAGGEPPPPLFVGPGPTAARRARFVAEFLRHGDATRAYVAAGYKDTAGARSHASRLAADPGIRAAIEAGRLRMARRFAIGPERVIEEFARVAFANVAHYLDIRDDGTTRLELQYAQPEHMAALRELIVEQHIDRPDGAPPVVRDFRLKLACKLRALRALTRYRGLLGKPPSSEEPR